MPSRSKSPVRKAGRPRRDRAEHDGNTERQILEAARIVFVRRGTAGARMQEIAEEAGVNPALLHYYFRSKDGLAQAVFREAASRIFPEVLRLLSADVPFEARIEQVVHHYIDNLRKHPFLPGYVLGELSFHPERILAFVHAAAVPGQEPRNVLDRLGRELSARVAAGQMRPIAPEQLLANLVSLCVFPFAARPLLASITGMDDPGFGSFLDVRRAELPGIILRSLRP